MSQVRPGSRVLFKRMMEVVDLGVNPAVWEETIKASGEVEIMERAGTAMERFKEDLYTVLVDKAEGEAMTRVKSHNPGEG